MLLVRETRNCADEIRHYGAVAIAGASGVSAIGDIGSPLPLRSTGKPFILATLLDGPLSSELFAAHELALMSSSHNGEARHVDGIHELLRRYKIPPELVRCGTHDPWRSWSVPSALGNNCSGKHAAFLIASQICGYSLHHYRAPCSSLQQLVVAGLSQVYESAPSSVAIDGCSLPTCIFPLTAMATTSRRYALDQLGESAARVRRAHLSAPYYVAGYDRLESYLIERYALAAKSGSDGLWTIGVPSLGIGLAGKVWSGVEAAVQMALLHILNELDVVRITDDPYLQTYYNRTRNCLTGEAVGAIEACFPVVLDS